MAISGASNPTFTHIDAQFKMGLGSIDKELRADPGGTALYTSNKLGKFHPSPEKLANRLMKQQAGKTFVKDAIDRQLGVAGMGERIFLKIGMQSAVKRSDLAGLRHEVATLNSPIKIEAYQRSNQDLLNLAITNPHGPTGAALTAFVNSEFSGENLNFLRDVHALKAMPANTPLEIAAINTEARRLATQYIGGQAQTEVNIAAHNLRQIDADLLHVGTAGYDARTLFDGANFEVTDMTARDTVKRFRTHEQI